MFYTFTPHFVLQNALMQYGMTAFLYKGQFVQGRLFFENKYNEFEYNVSTLMFPLETLPAVTGNTLVIDGCDMSNSHLLTQAYSDKIMIAALVTISFYAVLCLQCSGKVW